MRSLLTFVAVVVGIFAGTFIKSWQCGELFPHANQLACLFWK